MKTVTVRDLRNRGAEVLRRVEHGESLTVTRDGEAVASVVPLPRKALRAEDLISRRRALPRMVLRISALISTTSWIHPCESSC